MAGTLREFVTRFGFEIDDHGLKELDEGIEAVKEGILHLGEALIGEAVGLYELVNQASEAGVRLKIMSTETGVAADKLQELQFRAKLADVSADELNQSMNFLARNLTQAKNGSEEARKHFRMLGISTAELRAGTVTVDGALERMAKTLEKMPDGPAKTGLAMEAFGRSGARMVPFLKSLGEELDPLNRQIFEMSRVTDEQIESSEAFHVSLETLKTGLLGIARVVGFGLMPAANDIIVTMKKWIVQNRQLIVQNLTEFVKGMAAALKLTINISNALVQSFSGLAHGIGGVKIATELLLGAFAIISGATILFGLGKIATAFVLIAEKATLANISAFLIPSLIGAAFIALGLIIEDVYTAMSGKGASFTGGLLKFVPEIGRVFSTTLGPIFENIVTLITMMREGFGGWKGIISELGALIINVLLLPLRATLGAVATAGSWVSRLMGDKRGQMAAEKMFQFSEDYLKVTGTQLRGGHEQSRKEMIGPPEHFKESEFSSGSIYAQANRVVADYKGQGLTPQAAFAGAPMAAPAPVNRENNVEVTQQFNFPPGTDPLKAGQEYSSRATDGLNEVLRQTDQTAYDGGRH